MCSQDVSNRNDYSCASSHSVTAHEPVLNWSWQLCCSIQQVFGGSINTSFLCHQIAVILQRLIKACIEAQPLWTHQFWKCEWNTAIGYDSESCLSICLLLVCLWACIMYSHLHLLAQLQGRKKWQSLRTGPITDGNDCLVHLPNFTSLVTCTRLTKRPCNITSEYDCCRCSILGYV